MKLSFSSGCLEPKAHKSCREIKTRTWGNERYEIMYHFIWSAMYQRKVKKNNSKKASVKPVKPIFVAKTQSPVLQKDGRHRL